MKQVEIKDLKPWTENPRDLTESDFNSLIGQLRLGEIENLVVLKDGTVLNGNRRLAAYEKVGKPTAMVAEVEFAEAEGGIWHMFVDGTQSVRYDAGHEGEPTTFGSKEQGMLTIALAGNTHVGTWSEGLLEQLSQFEIPEDMFKVHMSPGTRVEDLIRAIGPTPEATGMGVNSEDDFDEDMMDEKLETYEHGTIKQVVIYFTNDQYLEVMPRIEGLLKRLKLKNNTELILEALTALERLEESDEV